MLNFCFILSNILHNFFTILILEYYIVYMNNLAFKLYTSLIKINSYNCKSKSTEIEIIIKGKSVDFIKNMFTKSFLYRFYKVFSSPVE